MGHITTITLQVRRAVHVRGRHSPPAAPSHGQGPTKGATLSAHPWWARPRWRHHQYFLCSLCAFSSVPRGGSLPVSPVCCGPGQSPLATVLSCVCLMGRDHSALGLPPSPPSAPDPQASEHHRRWGRSLTVGLQRAGWGLAGGALQMLRCPLMEIRLPKPATVRTGSRPNMSIQGGKRRGFHEHLGTKP